MNQKQANKDIRELIESNGLKYWQVALAYGKDATTFSKMLRVELNANVKEALKCIINDLIKANS